MSDITIYHNPDCGTSRNTLALIRASGIAPTVIEYLKTPPDRETLKALIARMGMHVRDVLRVKGTPYKELGLDAVLGHGDRTAATAAGGRDWGSADIRVKMAHKIGFHPMNQ
nr:ArsC/Spx/MgsR family protein [Pseudomonas aeruginosa]